MLIDDFQKADAALSAVERESAITTFRNTLMSRFDNLGEGRILINQFDALAGTPLAEARRIYDRVEAAANWVAGAVVVGLVIFAAWEAGLVSAAWRALPSIACG